MCSSRKIGCNATLFVAIIIPADGFYGGGAGDQFEEQGVSGLKILGYENKGCIDRGNRRAEVVSLVIVVRIPRSATAKKIIGKTVEMASLESKDPA